MSASTTKKQPKVSSDGLTKAQRRSRNLALRAKAEEQAKAAGLLFDSNVSAAEFFTDFDAAYEKATAKGPIVTEEEKRALEQSPAEQALGQVPDDKKVANDNPEPESKPAETVAEKPAVVVEVKKSRKVRKAEKAMAKSAAKAAKAVKPAQTEAPTEPPSEEPEPTPVNGTPTKQLLTLAKQTILGTSGGDVVYDSTNDHVKAAEQTEEEVSVDPALEDGRTMTEHGKEADAEQKPAQTEAPTEPPSEEPEPTPVEEKPVETVAETPKPVTKPTLVSDNPTPTKGDPAKAKAFYGKAFTDERAAALTEAHYYLEMALRCEAEKRTGNIGMAMNLALKKEAQAFGAEVAIAKAA